MSGLSESGADNQSTGEVDPQAPGWTKRVRVGNQLPNKQPTMDSLIADQAESGDAISAHSTSEWIHKPQVGQEGSELGKPTQTGNPAPSAQIESAPWSRRFAAWIWYKTRKK